MTTEEGSGWCRPSPDSPDCRLIDEGGEFRRQDLYVFVGVNFAHDVPMERYGGSFGVSRNLRHLLGVLFREHISVCIGGVFVASAATAFTTHSYLPFGSEPPRRFCNFIISPKAADVNLLWRCLSNKWCWRRQGELIIGEHISGEIHKTRRYGKYKTRRPRRREKW